jgi:hypothetical protein
VVDWLEVEQEGQAAVMHSPCQTSSESDDVSSDSEFETAERATKKQQQRRSVYQKKSRNLVFLPKEEYEVAQPQTSHRVLDAVKCTDGRSATGMLGERGVHALSLYVAGRLCGSHIRSHVPQCGASTGAWWCVIYKIAYLYINIHDIYT